MKGMEATEWRKEGYQAGNWKGLEGISGSGTEGDAYNDHVMCARYLFLSVFPLFLAV